eukprot:3799613-Rhodomonas_salina.2
MGFLYNRGTPDIRRDDMGNPGESRPANYGALGKTVGLCAIGGGLGFFLSQVPRPGLDARPRVVEAWCGLVV